MTLTFLGTSIEPNTDAMSLDKPDPGNAVPVSTIFQNFRGSSMSAFPWPFDISNISCSLQLSRGSKWSGLDADT